MIDGVDITILTGVVSINVGEDWTHTTGGQVAGYEVVDFEEAFSAPPAIFLSITKISNFTAAGRGRFVAVRPWNVLPYRFFVYILMPFSEILEGRQGTGQYEVQWMAIGY